MTLPIPVIDLAAASHPEVPASVLHPIRHATETLGIIHVVNHGISPDLISGFNQHIDRLLGLPRNSKVGLASPTGHPYRGWEQWSDDFGRLKCERFNVAQFDDVEHARAAGLGKEHLGLYAHRNMWPDDDSELRDLTFRYIAACQSLAERLLGLYSRAQGLPEGTFPVDPLPYLSLTVNNYPAFTYPDPNNREDELLLGEHVDDCVLTVLAQAGNYEGLQIRSLAGDWLTVPVVPGALLILSGSLLTRWSNGQLPAAKHRVVAGGTATRRSAAVFYSAALDRVLEPLAPFVEPGEVTGYEPVTQSKLVADGLEDYLRLSGRPAQLAAWREGKPYVDDPAENRRAAGLPAAG
jgi:flavonol synthase